MKKSISVFTSLLCCLTFFAASSQSVIAANEPIDITKPTIEQDALSEGAATKTGFIAAWSHGEITGPTAIVARQFDQYRKPSKPSIILEPKKIAVGYVELLSLNTDTVAAFWARGETLVGGLISLSQNKVSGIKPIDQPEDLIHDTARMTNGNIAMVMDKADASDPFDLREKISFLILSPSLKILKKATSVHGQGVPLDGWNTFDHTITELQTGGLVLFRNRTTGDLLARKFSASGDLLGSIYKINVTPMPLGTVFDFMTFNVKAVRLKDNKIAVVWTSMEGSSLDKWEIRARILDSSGKPLGKDFRVNTSIEGSQLSPDILALPNGDFCVTWVSSVGIGRSYFYRTYHSNGTPVFYPRISEQVPIYLSLPQETESVLLSNGSVITIMDGYGFPGPLRADKISQVAK